jgi:hypothetical protein
LSAGKAADKAADNREYIEVDREAADIVDNTDSRTF